MGADMKVNFLKKTLCFGIISLTFGSIIISTLSCNYRKTAYDLMNEKSVKTLKVETSGYNINNTLKNNFENKYNTKTDEYYFYDVENFYFSSSQSLIGVSYLSKDRMKELDFNIDVGNFPSKDDEVLITDFEYYLISKKWFKNNKNIKETITDKKDLISKEIVMNSKNFKISGILSTANNFDYSKYDSLFDENGNIIRNNSKLLYDLEDSFINNYSNAIYVSENKFNEFSKESSKNGGYLCEVSNYNLKNELIKNSLKIGKTNNELIINNNIINHIKAVKKIMLLIDIPLLILFIGFGLSALIIKIRSFKKDKNQIKEISDMRNKFILTEFVSSFVSSLIFIILLDLIIYSQNNSIFYLYKINLFVLLFILLLSSIPNLIIYKNNKKIKE